MTMQWFGPKRWGPACDDLVRVPIPVGMCCVHCEEPIGASDDGLMMLYVADSSTVSTVAWHWECHMRNIVGSVGHHLHKCSCYGGTEEDPPNMTRREAALAAVELYHVSRDVRWVRPDQGPHD
jgi:hypothetical protein